MARTRMYLLIGVIIFGLAACSGPAATAAPTDSPTSISASTPIPAATSAPGDDEAQAVSALVAAFGSKLHSVSLLSPTAAQDIQAQYSAYVSPDLINLWMSAPGSAPGTMTSSPWPDRIEVGSVTKSGPDSYSVEGNIAEITGVEANKGGVALRVPVHIVVTRQNGKWLITGYAQDNPSP